MENRMVRKANHLIEASYKLSAVEQKIVAVLASTVKSEDEDFKSYPIIIKDFLSVTGTEHNDYEWLENIIIGLKGKNLRIVFLDDDGIETIINSSWISSTQYKTGSGIIKLCFDPKLKPLFLQLKKRFTNYRLINIVQLKSQFSIRIYELLKQYEKLKQRLFEVSELRLILGIANDQYKLYSDFRIKVILTAQKELEMKTDLSFTFEEIKVGRAIGKIRFFIKSKTLEQAQLPEAETILPVSIPQENNDLEKLIALLPKDYQGKDAIKKILKSWLEKQNFDYVARNIEYANDGSNAVKPGANLAKGSNYRNYLSKALTGDFGLPHKEDKETKQKAEEDAKRKAQEEATAAKHRLEQAQNQKENHERAQVFQQSLSPEALKQLEAEAFSSLDPQQQELVKKNAPGSKMTLKIRMDKISLERMKIT